MLIAMHGTPLTTMLLGGEKSAKVTPRSVPVMASTWGTRGRGDTGNDWPWTLPSHGDGRSGTWA